MIELDDESEYELVEKPDITSTQVIFWNLSFYFVNEKSEMIRFKNEIETIDELNISPWF